MDFTFQKLIDERIQRNLTPANKYIKNGLYEVKDFQKIVSKDRKMISKSNLSIFSPI